MYWYWSCVVQTESFGKLVVENSVMTGGHYCKGKEAMSLISEVMTVLMFEQFKCDMELLEWCKLGDKDDRVWIMSLNQVQER